MLMISIKELDKKAHHNHAHSLLRECLRKKDICYNETTPIIIGKLGKPSLADHPGLHYNLSHADGIAACIVTDSECGIDCEKVRPHRPNVMKRAFSEAERKLMEDTPESERDLMFFRLWTLKEAYVKMLGIGVSYPLNTASFSFSGNEIITDIKDAVFSQYIIKNGSYVVSACKLSLQSE